jgi:hypothetical protein
MSLQTELIGQCGTLPGVAVGEGAFASGPALWVGKREVAHFDADHTLDVRLTREVIRARRSELKADGRITLRTSGSDWLEIRLETESDIEFALSLVGEAAAANLPTAKPGLAPTGAELERRRRFH